jgi:hypothetical protein
MQAERGELIWISRAAAVGLFLLLTYLVIHDSYQAYRDGLDQVQTVRGDGSFVFVSISDGPFVITHLARYGANEGDKATACLAKPICITDSNGARLSYANFNRLEWHSAITDEIVPRPSVEDKVVAIYYRATKSK